MLNKIEFHVLKISKLYIGKRLCHNKSIKDSLFKRIYDNLVIHVFGQQEKAFDSGILRFYYKSDKLDRQKWFMIYHDFDASRIGYIGSFSFAVVFVLSCFAAADYWIHGEPTLKASKLIKNDAEELGIFIIFPITMMVIVVSLLLRLHFLQIFRIYQNLQRPDDFAFVYPGLFRSSKMKIVSQSEISSKPLLYEDATKIGVIQSGNISIKNRSMIINLEAFRAQPYKSYMLQERNELPDNFDSFNDSLTSKFPTRKSSKAPPPPPMF